MMSPLKIPRAIPGARDRAEVAARAWLPVEENWKLAEVLGGRITALQGKQPPSAKAGPCGPVTTVCRRSGVR